MKRKVRDILEEKAKDTESLKSAAESSIPLDADDKDELAQKSGEDYNIKTIINEDGKKVLIFSDPLYSREKRSVVNYTIFRGKWEFENMDNIDENESDKCAVTFSPVKDGSNITIAFKSLKDRVEFMDSIYSEKEMHQTGGGMSLEKLANSKVLRNTGGIIGITLAGYGIYKLLTKSKDKNNSD
ncbi:MAG: hypothetical protein M1480_11725 [Bacteroidetes bacterium]|nr:hypothetical protein [Bacteroidota bacterium]